MTFEALRFGQSVILIGGEPDLPCPAASRGPGGPPPTGPSPWPSKPTFGRSEITY